MKEMKVHYFISGEKAGKLEPFPEAHPTHLMSFLYKPLTGKEVLLKDVELVSREVEQNGKPMRLTHSIESKVLKPNKWRVVEVGSNFFIEWYEKEDCNILHKTGLNYFHVVKEAK